MPEAPTAGKNPFPGLRPFKTEENYLFFGREGQADELLLRLRSRRFVAVVGTSGSGKSSLVRAGLLPALYSGFMTEAGSRWRVAVFRPINDPIGNLARALCAPGVFGADGGDGEESAARLASVETTLRRSSYGLIEAVRQGRLPEGENLLVVADQFEELFRFRSPNADGRHHGDEAESFVRLLLEAARQTDLPVFVILTMRSDYLGECAQFWGLPEAINEGQYLIPRMDDDERREAISGPVAVEGGEITSPLVNRLVNDLGDNPDQLPILQHALMRTWDYWTQHRETPSDEIDIPHYEQIGGMSRALSLHADEAFRELSPGLQKVAKKIFQALTEKEAENREVRRPTELGLLCEIAEADEAEVKAVVEVFRREGRSFLMPPPPAPLDAGTQIDISHESLIRNWEELKKWAYEEAISARTYLRLAQTASLHKEGHEELLRGAALQVALEWKERERPNAAWARRYDEEHGTSFLLALSFLAESRENREREEAEKKLQDEQKLRDAEALAEARRRSVRQLRWGLAVLSLFLVAMAGLAVYAFRQQREAQHQTGRAQTAFLSAATERDTATAAKGEAEKQRAVADEQRALAEDRFKEAEEQRKVAEEQRLAARAAEKKATDALAQAQAATAQAKRSEAEARTQRDNAERLGKEADAARNDAEEALIRAEREKMRAEAAETLAKDAQAKAEEQRIQAEFERNAKDQLLANLEQSRLVAPTPTPAATASPTPHLDPTPSPTPAVAGRPLSRDVLRQLMPNIRAESLDLYLPHIQQAMKEFDINTPARQAAFLAEVAHGTAELRFVEEIWGPTAAQRRYDPPSYLSRALGNTEPGDGKRYKGRGVFQITGRANYKKYGDMLGVDLVNNPELVTKPELVFRIGALVWKQRNLNELADKWNLTQITRVLNGGTSGLEDRRRYYERARSLLGVPPE
jgi:predicted chitinase/energy-coupling factor transporter ATP-binding protein EcfA2